MDCMVTPLKTLMGFSVHLNVQLKFYNLPNTKQPKISSGRFNIVLDFFVTLKIELRLHIASGTASPY